jgi:hypothetical protein
VEDANIHPPLNFSDDLLLTPPKPEDANLIIPAQHLHWVRFTPGCGYCLLMICILQWNSLWLSTPILSAHLGRKQQQETSWTLLQAGSTSLT